MWIKISENVEGKKKMKKYTEYSVLKMIKKEENWNELIKTQWDEKIHKTWNCL